MLLPSDFLLHNRYLIKSHIGQGGFGITYIAYDQQLAVQVCIKELFIGGSSTRNSDMSVQSHSLEAGFSFQDFVERFLDEARQLARFKHPNIVRVTDVFKENNTAYMVMEFVEGETLQALVNREGALPESKALALLGQVLDAVEEVHKKGMLHRDIKPENILVTEEGTVVLIDFGSAREFAEGKTTTQTAMITPGYAPIEQYSNRAQRGTYTDIYALGATLYYMITGQKPIPATDRNLEMLVSPHELNNQISPQLSSAVMMAMAMKPEDRFQGIGDVRQAVSFLQQEQSANDTATKKEKTSAPGESKKAAQDKPKAQTSHNDAINKPVGRQKKQRWLVPMLLGIIAIAAVGWFMRSPSETAAEDEVEYTTFASDGGTYAPVEEDQKSKSFSVTYYQLEGANRPSCTIVFSDDLEIFTNASCPGDFSWCLRDGEFNELGSMKLQFTADGKGAYIDIKEGQSASRYQEYLSALRGRLTRIETAEQVLERIEEEKHKAKQLAEQQRLEEEQFYKKWPCLIDDAYTDISVIDSNGEKYYKFTYNGVKFAVELSTGKLYEGNTYTGEQAWCKIVTIGTQVWMAENLNVSKFRNGDPIPEAKSDEEWVKAGENKQPAWCYYLNDPANGEKYGKLYNWYAVNDPRGLAPAGWHVCSDAEWNVLVNYLGGDASRDVGTKMKSASGWQENGNGTNSSGFSGLPGGYRYDDGKFYSIGKGGNWWSSTEGTTGSARSRYLYYNDGAVYRSSPNKDYGFSVRCLRD